MSKKMPNKKKIFCNNCKIETNHIIKGEHPSHFYEEVDGQLAYWEENLFRFWVCAGCDQGTLEDCYTMSGLADHDGEQIYECSYYPPRRQGSNPTKQFINIPKNIKKLYQESVEALNNNLLILCAGGLRALIESICVDKKIKGKDLKQKIGAMTSILPQNIVDNLHSFRFMGNNALHKLESPTKRNLKLATEICEDILNFLYELNYKTSQLNKDQRSKNT